MVPADRWRSSCRTSAPWRPVPSGCPAFAGTALAETSSAPVSAPHSGQQIKIKHGLTPRDPLAPGGNTYYNELCRTPVNTTETMFTLEGREMVGISNNI
jgi:hypothetical protein